MAVKNRFNNIDSKEWLPFQKSWFVPTNTEQLYRSNIRFFTQANEENPEPSIFYAGSEADLFSAVAADEGRKTTFEPTSNLSFAVIDLRDKFQSLESYLSGLDGILATCQQLFETLQHRKFLCIHIANVYQPGFYPIAWHLAKSLQHLFSLKDEKIGCVQKGDELAGDEIFYSLYFRKDEKSEGIMRPAETELLRGGNTGFFESTIGHWQVVRPPRRKKNEILHPAKYPEALVEQFIKAFTAEGANVFDPMSGTGSTQVAALSCGRNGFGTELSPFFHEIAMERCQEMAFGTTLQFDIKLHNAKEVAQLDFPAIDYLITSPPYWDMLNMKGAEYQARRKEKGLQLNYSDDTNDLGNIADYQRFVDELIAVYKACDKILKPGAFVTIVVKNIKKKGSNYPFAWDLSQKLIAMGWELLPEFFWCQDDINLAPYGYGNTWVSNTFHQYCLNFRKRTGA
ncbi:hypothetical protein GC194_06565 [bacterium]|nr:hypothetical protein [bacterium]